MHFFSSKQLHGKSASDRHEMLDGIGKNWAKDVPACFRNGSFILGDKVVDTVQARYDEIYNIVSPLVFKNDDNDNDDDDDLIDEGEEAYKEHQK